MFIRVSYFNGTGPQLDAAIEVIRDRIDPSLRTQAGYLGSVTLIDRESGQGAAGTYWETVGDMSAAEEMAVAGRSEATERAGIRLVDVDRFESVLDDRVGARGRPAFVRTTEVRGLPDKVEAALALVREQAIPGLRSRSGYRGTVAAVNRATGRMLVSSIWESAAEREASDQNATGIREAVAQAAGARGFRIVRSEMVLSTMSPAAFEAGSTAQTA